MAVDEMAVDEMSADEMTVKDITLGENAWKNIIRLNQYLALATN
jgi:hypothetical protein